MASAVSAVDYQALAAFRYEIRRFVAVSDRFARSAGLEPQQQLLLLAIKGLPVGQTATIRTLATRMHLRHHSVVELVDRLATQGLVARARNQPDRRQVEITLTAVGERRLEPVVQKTLEVLGEAGPELLRALATVIMHVGALA